MATVCGRLCGSTGGSHAIAVALDVREKRSYRNQNRCAGPAGKHAGFTLTDDPGDPQVATTLSANRGMGSAPSAPPKQA
jgi:hypothetical protein